LTLFSPLFWARTQALRDTAAHGLWEELKIRPPPPEAERWQERAAHHHYEVLPVYVFDVAASHALLLDRDRQVVALEDMVLVVRSRTPSDEQLLDLQCDEQVRTDEPFHPMAYDTLSSQSRGGGISMRFFTTHTLCLLYAVGCSTRASRWCMKETRQK